MQAFASRPRDGHFSSYGNNARPFSIEFDGSVPCELTSAPLQASGKKEWRNVEGCGLFWSMGFLSQLPRRAKHRPSERALTGTARLTRRLMRVARSLANLVRRHRSMLTSGQGSNSRTISRFRRNCTERRSRGEDGARRLRGTFPRTGWKDILWRVYASVNDNRLLAVAAGVVFYSLLAIFPAVAAFVSLYGLIADASTIDSHLSIAAGIFPAGAVDILHDQITKLAAKSDAKLSLGFMTGLGVALWSANSGMKAIIDALNVVYDEKEKRSFVKLNLVSLLFTFVAILSLMVALSVIVIAPIVFSAVGLSSLLSLAIVVLRWPLLLVLATVALAAIYRYGPSRREARWQWLSVGSAAAAIGWLISSVLFSWYIANFGAYNATYGSLGAAVGMMMWMWISAIVILLGAELNAEIEHQTARDSTVGSEKPLGRAGRRDGRHNRGGKELELRY